MDIEQRMGEALDNYLALSYLLSEDFDKFLDTENDSQGWRRNYIRIVVALIEGYSHCFSEMAVLGLECSHPDLSNKERKALESGFGFSASERVKYTLKATYKMFDLSPVPEFGSEDWEKALVVFDKRHSITHPKVPGDLEITDQSWDSIRKASNWLMKCHFDVAKILYEKHIQKNR